MRYPRHNTRGQRQHTNPKARLRLWEASGFAGDIWCYRKEPGPGDPIYRQKVATATVLYGIWSEDDEERLNREVEQPAEAGLAQLVGAEAPELSASQRQAVARYLLSLFRRGWQEIAAQPQRVQPEVRRMVEMVGASRLTAKAQHVIEEELEDVAKHPPGRPFPVDQVSEVLSAMRWTVLRCANPSFVTGDSPAQIVPHVVVDRRCEVTLALSPTRALVCDWGIPQPWTSGRTATAEEILEVNRRTALGADSFVYFASRPSETYVQQLLAQKPQTRISKEGSRRCVPWKHRQTMEVSARRIMRDEMPAGNIALIKQLEELEARYQLAINDGDST